MENHNLLAQETSPYLLQHANNPVHWYPWGQAALEQARSENKPILLSIGYAACHWCHVMAHESFEDAETAALMNKYFINIKVDREERPDLDKIYQTTHYMLTQRSGGWPLTVFVSPDSLTPFFSGTYFPPVPRQQMPSFRDILQKIADIFRDRQDDIKKQNDSVQRVLLQTLGGGPTATQLDNHPVALAVKSLENTFDPLHGGFGDAPKFPHATILEFLLQEQPEMVLTTLLCMAEGGIYDQLSGGFYRYSVDKSWEIPHFEKMLYDNAHLLHLYATASKTLDEPFFADIAAQTAAWIIAEMQAPEGGYYSSLDADSEGHEGKFYVWDKAEVEKILTGEEFQMAKIYFGLDEAPNFDNAWHLHIVEALKTPQEKTMLASAKKKLLAARAMRVHPHRDEKILTSWNALTIKGMLVAGNLLNKPEFTASAKKSLAFIQKHMWKNQHLAASYKDGKARYPGFLDDYAYLLDAVITAQDIDPQPEQLQFAIALADTLLNHFFDNINGGFFFTPDDHEELLYRPKTLMDESIPAGNGIAVQALLRLSQLTDDRRYQDAAEKTLQLGWLLLSQYPAEHCSLLLGLKSYLSRR